jgi:hypothetical protein
MKTEQFEKLCRSIMACEVATIHDRCDFVHHARQLRAALIESLSRSDDWDKEEPLLGYEPYTPGSDEEGTALREWSETQVDLLYFEDGTYEGKRLPVGEFRPRPPYCACGAPSCDICH